MKRRKVVTSCKVLLPLVACVCLAACSLLPDLTGQKQLETLAQNSTPRGDSAGGQYNIEQAISDRAQLSTIAFDALAWLTGDFCSDTFLPPGKVTDYFGFQYLRDNDPDEMGHNTSFVPRIANNVLSILTDEQIADLIALAQVQVDEINQIAYNRFPMIDAFRRHLEEDVPTGSDGLDQDAVMDYAADLFRLDGEVSLGRAQGLGQIARSLTPDQQATLDRLASSGSLSWPDLPDQIDKGSMSHDVHVAVMTYASEFFSWYTGSVEADAYFCPERHGTYFGSFYLKDMPAMGNPDYSIPTELTGDKGEAFLNLLTNAQRAVIEGLVDEQRDALQEIVSVRREISTELRKLMTHATIDEARIVTLAERYGELDGEIAYLYATTFTEVWNTLTDQQMAQLEELRDLDGFPCSGAFLFSESIAMPEIINTDFLFGEGQASPPAEGSPPPRGDDNQQGRPPGEESSPPRGDDNQQGPPPGEASPPPRGDDSQQGPPPGGESPPPRGDDNQQGPPPGEASPPPRGDDSQQGPPPGGESPPPRGDDDQQGPPPGEGAPPAEGDGNQLPVTMNPFYTVVDTGQNTCYDNDLAIPCPWPGDAFYGQDAQYNGTRFAFRDNGDGTVTDLNTGLVWQKTPDFQKRSQSEALAYASSLELAGNDDWRLPTITELYSIIDYSEGWPYLDETVFDFQFDSQDKKNSQYWSSTDYEVGTTHGGQETAFGVNFATGHIKGYPDQMPAYVRCVRGDGYGANTFIENGDGTVTDLSTGLMWQQVDDGTGRDWEDALAYAESLELAGHDDWCLPNAKELQSIVDYSGNYPAIDSWYFETTDAAQDGWFWTSTSAYFGPPSPDYVYAWYVAFGYATDSDGQDLHGAGAVRFATKAEGGPAAEKDEQRIYNFVRCVRADR